MSAFIHIFMNACMYAYRLVDFYMHSYTYACIPEHRYMYIYTYMETHGCLIQTYRHSFAYKLHAYMYTYI